MLQKLLVTLLIPFAINCQQPPPYYRPQAQQSQQYFPPYEQSINCVFTSNPTTSTYDCVSINLTITERYQSINFLQGEHIRNLSNYDVNGLKVSSQICHFIPSQLSRIIPTLQELQIVSSGLLEVSSSDTFDLKSLRILNLRGNRIEKIEYSLFKFNTELTSVDFSDNFIQFVANDIFNTLHKLKFVDFSNNICVKNAPASDNVREWERELKRNCDVDNTRRGLTRPLWKIYQILFERLNGNQVTIGQGVNRQGFSTGFKHGFNGF